MASDEELQALESLAHDIWNSNVFTTLYGEVFYKNSIKMPLTPLILCKYLNFFLYAYWFHMHLHVGSEVDPRFEEVGQTESATPEIHLTNDLSIIFEPEAGFGLEQEFRSYKYFCELLQKSNSSDDAMYMLDKLLDHAIAVLSLCLIDYEKRLPRNIDPTDLNSIIDEIKSYKLWREGYQFVVKDKSFGSGMTGIMNGINSLLFRFCQACKDSERQAIINSNPELDTKGDELKSGKLSRAEIVNNIMSSPKDFNDSKKVLALAEELDTNNIPMIGFRFRKVNNMETRLKKNPPKTYSEVAKNKKHIAYKKIFDSQTGSLVQALYKK